MSLSFQIEGVRIGSGNLFLIAGPCVIESEKHALCMEEVIKFVTGSLNTPFIFKVSYHTPNLTSIPGSRGQGLEGRLPMMKKVKDEVHLHILTVVHEKQHVARGA